MRFPTTFVFACAVAAAHAAQLVPITTPNAPWTIAFAMDGVQMRSHEIKPNTDSGSFLFTRKTDGVSISVFIEPAKECKSAEQCRDKLFKVLQAKLDGTEKVTQGQIGDASTIEIFVLKQRNLPIHEKNLYAEFYADGYWVDVRLSKGGFKPDDQARLEALVQSVRFEPRR
jgi:hypothetical protein